MVHSSQSRDIFKVRGNHFSFLKFFSALTKKYSSGRAHHGRQGFQSLALIMILISGALAAPLSANAEEGETWTTRSFPETLSHPRVVYAGGQFLLADGDPNDGSLYTSPDGFTWTKRTVSPKFKHVFDFAYGNGVYVATGQNINIPSSGMPRMFYSTDAITWTETNPLPIYGNHWSIAFGAGKFVASMGGCNGGATGKCVIYSTNGIDWTLATTPDVGQGPITNIADTLFDGTQFYTVSGGGAILTSPNGVNWTYRATIPSSPWTSYINEFAFGNSTVVAVGPNSWVYSSTTPGTWTSRTGSPSSSTTWVDIAFGQTKFVAISGQGNVMRSSNGVTWTSSGTLNAGNSPSALTNIAYGNGVFLAFGAGNSYFTSSEATAPSAPTSLSATSDDSQVAITFTAGSDGGSSITNYKYSLDGVNYTPLSPPDSSSPITVGGLTNGTSYSLYIKAVNAFGDSSASVPVTITPKATPTLSWSNLTKTFGDSNFTLTAPTASVPGTFTYSSSSSAVISLDGANSQNASVVGAGSSTITASFTPTNTSTHKSVTTTMTVEVSKTAQAALALSLSTSSKNFPYSQAITFSTTGGSGTGSVSYNVVAGGTASGCSLASALSINTLTATSGGTCLIRASKGLDSNYLAAESTSQAFAFNAPMTITYAAGENGLGTPPTGGTFFAGDVHSVASGASLNRPGFTFNGWKNSSNSAVAANSSLNVSGTDTLTAQWRQTSLFGVSDSELTEIQSWNASASTVSSTVSNPSNTSSVTVTMPGGSLPIGTTVKLWEIGNSNLAVSKVGSGNDYVVNLVLSWLKASDGTVPTATSPITISIANNTIVRGAKAYQIIGDSVTQIGTADVDGTITISITEDPILIIANPAPASSSGASIKDLPLHNNKLGLPSGKLISSSGEPISAQKKITIGRSNSSIGRVAISKLRKFLAQVAVKQDIEKIEVVGYSALGAGRGAKPDIALARSVTRLVKEQTKGKKVSVRGGGIGGNNSNYVMINIIEKAAQNTQGK